MYCLTQGARPWRPFAFRVGSQRYNWGTKPPERGGGKGIKTLHGPCLGSHSPGGRGGACLTLAPASGKGADVPFRAARCCGEHGCLVVTQQLVGWAWRVAAGTLSPLWRDTCDCSCCGHCHCLLPPRLLPSLLLLLLPMALVVAVRQV